MFTERAKDLADFEMGLNAAVNIIATTIGPYGTNVSVAGAEGRWTFDDGFEAIKAFVPENVFEREAAFRVRDALVAQRDKVGDGTSTTALLLRAFYFAGRKLVEEGLRPRDVVRAFEKMGEQACEYVDKLAVPAKVMEGGVEVGDTDLLQKVCTVAMHGDKEMGGMIGGLVAELGPHGIVDVQMTSKRSLYVTRTHDYAWKGGVARGSERAFYNTGSGVEHGRCVLILANETLETIKVGEQGKFWDAVFGKVWPQACEREGAMVPLVLVCRAATGSVLSTFHRAEGAGGQKVPMCIVQAPGSDDDGLAPKMLQDLAALTGAKVFDSRRGNLMDGKVTLGDMGWCEAFKSNVFSTSVKPMDKVDDGWGSSPSDEIRKAVVAAIDLEYSAEGASDDPVLMQHKQRRLAAVLGATGTVYVPFTTETGAKTLMESVQDGIRAAQSAMDGVVPGGGKALYLAADEADFSGINLKCTLAFREALEQPIVALWRSCTGTEVGLGDQKFTTGKEWLVMDYETGEEKDAREIGILDSSAVIKSAIRTALSVALPLVNTGVWLVAKQ